MNTKIFSYAIALIFLLSACDSSLFLDDVSGNVDLKSSTFSTLIWNGASDKAVSVNIDAEKNDTRKNASGAKIPSNAHSADFPGLYFIWDAKQKDNGYLKVAAGVFDLYDSFVLTSKESNTFWDFKIAVQPGQQKTADNCYVFFIPKVYNNKNINMVFLSEWQGKTIDPKYPPIIPDDPIEKGKITFLKVVEDASGKAVDWTDWDAFSFDLYDGEDLIMSGATAVDGVVTFESELIKAGNTYNVVETIHGIGNLFEAPLAGASFVANKTFTLNSSDRPSAAVEVDPANSWGIGDGLAIKAFWESKIQNQDALAAMKAITVDGVAPTWIWDRYDPWEYGKSGSASIYVVANMNIDGDIVGDEVPFYFAADNAAVVFVNGKIAGYTTKSFAAVGIVPEDDFKFNNFSDNDFGDLIEHWSWVYTINIKPFLKQGNNEIKIAAANNDECGGKYDQTNNPAGLIYACTFEVAQGSGDKQFVNTLKPEKCIECEECEAAGGKMVDGKCIIPPTFGQSYSSVTATNDVKNPLVVPVSNHFTYAQLSRDALEKGVTLDLVVGNKIDLVGKIFVQLVDGEIVITFDGGKGSYGAAAFNVLPEPSNGNIHSMDGFKHNSPGTIACPAGDTIFLYIHFDNVKFYLN